MEQRVGGAREAIVWCYRSQVVCFRGLLIAVSWRMGVIKFMLLERGSCHLSEWRLLFTFLRDFSEITSYVNLLKLFILLISSKSLHDKI